MSQIGFVKQESFAVKDRETGKEEIKKWLECHFRVGGMRPFSAKMVPNKNKDKDTAPDFHIYLRANVNKGDKFRDIRVGALWLKKKMIDNVETTFMTGNIFMDFREIPIAVWKAKPRFEGDVVNYLYDISMMSDNRSDNAQDGDGGYSVSYEGYENPPSPTDADIPAVDPNEDIPF